MNQGQISGSIKEIGSVETITAKSGNMFYKRRLILDASVFNQTTGDRYENILPLDFLSEKVRELDAFAIGERVTVTYSLRGNGGFTSIRPYKIEHAGDAPKPQPQQQQQQQQGYTTTRTDDYAAGVPQDFQPRQRQQPTYNPQDLPW